MAHRRNNHKFIDEYRSRQRNIVFPDTVRNGRLVDVFIWKGSPHPTLVQRIAAWMFGVFFIGFGLWNLSLDVKARIEEGFSIGVVFWASISVSFILLGIRVFRNGFTRPTKPVNSK
jgi:uncharacterized membrane protein